MVFIFCVNVCLGDDIVVNFILEEEVLVELEVQEEVFVEDIEGVDIECLMFVFG